MHLVHVIVSFFEYVYIVDVDADIDVSMHELQVLVLGTLQLIEWIVRM